MARFQGNRKALYGDRNLQFINLLICVSSFQTTF